MTGVETFAVGLGAVGAAGLGYSLWEARDYRVQQLRVPMLAPGSAPFRILHISDLHLTPRNLKLVKWLGGLAALSPDLVIGTGDFIAHRESVPVLRQALAGLLDLPGAFVLGSNDYYAPTLRNPARYLRADDGRRFHGPELPWSELRAQLASSGWKDLSNARTNITVAGREVELRGVDDPHIGRDQYEQIAGPTGGQLNLGVAHAPYRRVLDAMASDGVELLLAGHTHGGQLRLPGFGAIVTNCDLPRQRAAGLSRQPPADVVDRADRADQGREAMFVHVSAGLGTNPYTPVRFCCPPTATLLTLTPA